MPRRSRIHLPEIPLHMVQRGHNRAICLTDPLIRPHAVYKALGNEEGARCKHYRLLFRTQLAEGPIEYSHGATTKLALGKQPACR